MGKRDLFIFSVLICLAIFIDSVSAFISFSLFFSLVQTLSRAT